MAKIVHYLLVFSLILNCSFLILAFSSTDIINTAQVQSGTQDSNLSNNSVSIKDINNQTSSSSSNSQAITNPNQATSPSLSRTGGYQKSSYIISLFTIFLLISYFLYEHQNNNKN